MAASNLTRLPTGSKRRRTTGRKPTNQQATTSRPLRCAVYLRISRDPDGTSTAPDRQLRDCERFAELREWETAEVFEDRDVSAFQEDAVRPRYEELLDRLDEFDVVLVWRLDRLVRRTREFSRFWDHADEADVRLASATQPIDTSDPVGMLIVTILVAFAQMESETMSVRMRSKIAEGARQGKARPSGYRAFGLNDDWTELVPHEAEVAAEMAHRALAGESLTSLVRDLIDRDISTVTGAPWHRRTLKRLLTSARLFGWREHNGELTAPGTWPAIIDETTGLALRAMYLTEDGTSTSGGPGAGKYLNSGRLRCGACGRRMFSQNAESGRRYVCPPRVHGGCGKVSLRADPSDQAVDAMIAGRLEDPAFVDEFESRQADKGGRDADLIAEVARLDQVMAENNAARLSGDLSLRAYLDAQAQADARYDEINTALAKARSVDPLRSVQPGPGAAGRYLELPLERRRAIVGAMVKDITVLPKTSPLYLERLRVNLAAEADEMQAQADEMRAQAAGLGTAEARALRAEATELAKFASRRRVQARTGTGGGRWRPERLDPAWLF